MRVLEFVFYVGIGGDPIRGTTMVDAVKYYNEDPKTKILVLIGEIGGSAPQDTADFLKSFGKKPVVAYVAGKSAPERQTMGHAGAIISGDVILLSEKSTL